MGKALFLSLPTCGETSWYSFLREKLRNLYGFYRLLFISLLRSTPLGFPREILWGFGVSFLILRPPRIAFKQFRGTFLLHFLKGLPVEGGSDVCVCVLPHPLAGALGASRVHIVSG